MLHKKSRKPTKRAGKTRIDVVELFAGVGGFRLGLEGRSKTARKKSRYRTVWANQWEPATRIQHAFDVYKMNFQEESEWPDARWQVANDDINEVINHHFDLIPDHDLLCGGFPCQDYSVAKTLKQAAGIIGRKGVLWWSIHDILAKMMEKSEVRSGKRHRPVPFILLENVDRLLGSPAKQRGRDFAIMLASLANLGYAVEWRVVNAADYGFPQRRRRVFIVGYHETTETYQRLKNNDDRTNWLDHDGVLAHALPVHALQRSDLMPPLELEDGDHSESRDNLIKITKHFNREHPTKSPFGNAGVMIDFDVWTCRTTPKYSGKQKTLGTVLAKARDVPEEFFIDSSELKKWKYLKGAKHEKRVDKKTGYEYSYDEGGMAFPDPLDRPSRTIITGEGGKTPSRFKHVVKRGHRYRRLTPIELEKLNGFRPNHTKLEGISDVKRAFFMGNALVVGVVERIGKALEPEILADKRKR